MEWNKQTMKNLFLLVCGGVVVFVGLQNLRVLIRLLQGLIGVASPFLLGCAIAFVLNVPMRAIERRLFNKADYRVQRLRRPVAMILTLLAVLGVLTLAALVIVPGVRDAVLTLVDQVPAALIRLEATLMNMQEYLPQLEDWMANLNIDWGSLSQKAAELLQTWGGSLISSGGGLVGGVVSGVTNFIIGLIFAFYLLVQKEKLARQGRQVFYALLPEKKADNVLAILRMSNCTFSNFLSGQCLEAVILGTMFVVIMGIFRMPYALLIGVVIALTALVPIVGAFIGCGVGALLIAITSPVQALVFIIMFLILQQIEGNVIYPFVVGSSVGLPSIWVLAAVMLGGGLMGILGILLFIPLCSVLYTLFRGYVKKQLEVKSVPQEKWKE